MLCTCRPRTGDLSGNPKIVQIKCTYVLVKYEILVHEMYINRSITRNIHWTLRVPRGRAHRGGSSNMGKGKVPIDENQNILIQYLLKK